MADQYNSNHITNYLRSLSTLHSDRSKERWPAATMHRAPHKPLLLLSVIDLFAEGQITSNLIELTPDLCETFSVYWSRVMPPDRRSNIALPFFHLKGDGFWHLIPSSGKDDILAATPNVKSVNQLRDLVLGTQLDEELFSLFCNAEARGVLRAVLIEEHFSPELQKALIEQGSINVEAYIYSRELLEHTKAKSVAPPSEIKPAARDQGFRRAVVTAYSHRCAICGLRVVTADGHTIVDAAHIIPWSLTHNDSPNNGLALCRVCHWCFDEGMLGVSTRYLILVSPQVSLERNNPNQIATLADLRITDPTDARFLPDVEALKWHRKAVFRSR